MTAKSAQPGDRPLTLDITVLGREYKVACKEHERDALVEAVSFLDARMREIRDTGKVVGVEPELAPTLTRALAAGRPVDAEAGGIAADSLAPRRVGEQVFPVAQAHVAEVVLVTDESIRQAQEALWNTVRVVAEPGGAAGLAALLAGRYRPHTGERVGVVISGGNTVAVAFDR